MAMTSTERSRRRRQMQRKDATAPCNVADATENQAPDATVCTHPPIVPVTAANRHLTYSKYSLAVSDLTMPEPKLVTCPCCGKEWLCKRPDVQDAYCLRCDPVVGHCWRVQHPYLRPPMEPPSVLKGICGSAAH